MRIRAGTWMVYAALLCAVGLVSYLIWRFSVAAPIEDDFIATPTDDRSSAEAPDSDRGLRVRGGELIERDADGNIVWKVNAQGEFTYDEKSGVARGQDVAFAVVLGDERGLDIVAPEFEVSYSQNRAVFTGGVKVVSKQPQAEFEASRATYDIEKRVLTASDGVKGLLKERGLGFDAASLEYDIESEAFVAGGGAVVRQGPFEARADEVTVDLKKRQTHWRGNVRMAWRR